MINESRMRTMRQYNLPLLENVRTVGRYGMPMLEEQDVTAPETLIGFNYVAAAKKTVQELRSPFLHRRLPIQQGLEPAGKIRRSARTLPMRADARFQHIHGHARSDEDLERLPEPSDRGMVAVLRAESHSDAPVGGSRIILLLLFGHSKQLHRRGQHGRMQQRSDGRALLAARHAVRD